MTDINARNNSKRIIPILIFNAVLVVLAIFRAMLCITVTDEVFNIGQSFRTIQGNLFLVENWDYFQTGDSFLTPFLYVFYRITGSTEGIVLFSRIVFIVLQVLLSVFLYKILSRFFESISALFAVMIYSTAVSFLLFYMWYDNWEIFFRLIGLFLVFYAVAGEKTDAKKTYISVFIAGIVHACMVFAYPTMAAVYVYILILLFAYKRKQSTRANTFRALAYILGAALVFAIFVVYVLMNGVSNLFIFNNVMSEAGLSSTGREGFFAFAETISKIKALIVENVIHYMFALIIFAVDIAMLYVFRKSRKRGIIFCSIMIAGCIVLLMMTVFRSDSLNTLMTYLSLYTIPLYLLIRKKSEKKNAYKDLIIVLSVSSLLAGIVYSMTALNGAIKFSAGARAGAIVTVLLLFELLRKSDMKLTPKISFGIIASLMMLLNVFALYSFSFEGLKPYDCNTMIKSGIYKGIIDIPVSAKRYETVEKDLAEVITEGDKTITCGPFAMEFYLMSDLKPDAANLWAPNNTGLLFAYYDKYYGEPDIIVLHDSAWDETNPEFIKFVDENYKLVKYTDGFLIYHHN